MAENFTLTVRGEGDEGYVRYDKPVAENFILTGYRVDKAYYFLSSEEREIGMDGDEMKFVGENYSLSMYPSESVTLRYRLDAYFPEDTKVVFESSNENIVTVIPLERASISRKYPIMEKVFPAENRLEAAAKSLTK